MCHKSLVPTLIVLLALFAPPLFARQEGGGVEKSTRPLDGSRVPFSGAQEGTMDGPVVVISSSRMHRILSRSTAVSDEVLETTVDATASGTDEARAQATVRLSVDGAVILQAIVTVHEHGMTVVGSMAEHTFRNSLEILGERFRIRNSWDDGALAYDSGLITRGPGPQEALERFADYNESVRGTFDFSAVARMRRLIEDSPAQTAARLDIYGLIVGLAADGRAEALGKIGSYMNCLEEGCRECGGIWSHSGCHSNTEDPMYLQIASFGCYTFVSELCWFDLINPISGWK